MKSTGGKKQKVKTLAAKPSSRARFPIVGIGASAGGLEAFTELLKNLPTDTGFGFVLVQHLDPQHDSALPEILGRATSMPVRHVTDNVRVQPNHVHVIPPNTALVISRGVLKLQRRQTGSGAHRTIDFFFESLAQDQQECAIGVVLSGTATDGTLGLEMIKAEGGVTFAQDKSARYDSMPRSAVAAGCVDFELSPDGIAEALGRIARHPLIANGGMGLTSSAVMEEEMSPGGPKTAGRSQEGLARRLSGETDFRKIMLALRNHRGVDFSLYKPSTIERRITRRMVLNQNTTLRDYAQFLKGNLKELDLLYSDVLIGVTSFFRNPEAFDVLKAKVFPELLKQPRHQNPVRIWTLGCSSGQEAYSIAMAYTEFCDKIPRAPKLQIFATDLNDAMLDRARRGLYAQNVVADVSPERLRRFFVAEEGGYRVCKPLRDACVFARQNLLSDPPFSRMDLISCRNLLIYIEPGLQKKILPNFHYALKPGGFLFLGASESIGSFTNLFEPADKKQKIFIKKSTLNPGFLLPVSGDDQLEKKELTGGRPETPRNAFGAELSAQREADRLLAQRFSPACVLINADLEVLQFRGPTGAFLEPPKGKASFNVLKMAREGLMLPLRATINKAKKENKTVRRENVWVSHSSADMVSLEVMPLKNLRESCFLILFDSGNTAREDLAATTIEPMAARRLSQKEESVLIKNLERELAENRDYLQSILEQHEAADEELQASNEEVQSANEELQSINEELETSKEELESTNEELTTVNEEMTNRNVELNHLNADLNNLQAATKLPVVLLGRNLSIRRFSAAAEKIFSLLATDVGRPWANIRHSLELHPGRAAPAGQKKAEDTQKISPLEQIVREVIDTVREQEREVRDQDGVWYSLRVRPYMTLDNKVDGAVLVLVDIDNLKRIERTIKGARDYAEATIRAARDPLVVLRHNLQVNTANEAFYKTFKTTPHQTEGHSIFTACGGALKSFKLRALLENALTRNSFFNDFEITQEFPGLGLRTMLLNARPLDFGDGSPSMLLLSIQDFTERRRSQVDTAALASIVNSSDDAIIGQDLKGVIISWNQSAERLFGHTAAEAVGKRFAMLISRGRRSREEFALMARLKRGEIVEHLETRLLRKDGSRVDVSLTCSPMQDAAGKVIGSSKIARDITEAKKIQQLLMERARLLDLSNDAIIARGLDDRISLWNKGAEKLYGWTAEEVMGTPLHALLKTEFPQPMEQILSQLKREGQYTGEVVQAARDGRRVPSICRWVLDPKTGSILTSYTDISERKRSEEALIESEQRYRTLFNLSPVAVYAIDAKGIIQNFNRHAAELWGREPGLGDPGQRFCGSLKMFSADGCFMPHDQCPMAEVISGKLPKVDDEEVSIERPDGSRVMVILNIRPLMNDRGEVMGAINCFYDITERKRVEDALRQAQAQLADRAGQLENAVAERTFELTATNKQLETFVYSIAHDLRAPLRSMQGFSALLVEEAGAHLSETGKDLASRISRSAQRMDALLKDLLAFSRISQEHLEVGAVKLGPVVRMALSRLEQDIQEKKVRVDTSGPWPTVLAHNGTVEQVLVNLLGNAIKFSTPGTLPVIRLWAEERAGFARVWVEDNGIGIAPEFFDQIFRLFTRLQGEKFSGTGVGLAIVQKGVERMGGRVGVDSILGQGSRFWFELRNRE